VRRLGLLRAYATRHGAGPFVTEDARLTQTLPDAHNGTNAWQQGFRVGYFDAVAARYALEVTGGVDELVLTNVDRLYGQTDWRAAVAYQYGGTAARPAALETGGLVERLVPGPFMDLAYQEALTGGLLLCRPHYRLMVPGVFAAASVPGYCEAVEAALGYPIGLMSAGPTAADKIGRRS
jgi:adenylosuccinate synthase